MLPLSLTKKIRPFSLPFGLSLSFCLALLSFAFVLAAEPPGIINHQGRIAVSGVNHSGPGYFKFALLNSTGATTFWSNDGTSVAGSEPASAIETPVVSGHYSIPLGDTGYHPNMTETIPKTVFIDNSDVRLAIWFSRDNSSFQKLSPDRRIASAAYALSAGSGTPASGSIGSEQIADGSVSGPDLANGAVGTMQLADSSITAGKVADGAIGTTQLAAGSVTSAQLADGQVTTPKLAADAVTGAKVLDGSIESADLADGSVTSAKIATGAVESTHLASSSVGAAQLADGSVTASKIANGAIAGTMISPGALSEAAFDSSIGLWARDGANVFRPTGNVGIGTAAPSGLFEVHGEATLGAETLDQEVLTPASATNLLWQSFTPEQSGRLTRLELKVGSPLGASSSSGTIKIYSGEGLGGIVLASEAVTFAVVPQQTYQSFTLSTSVAITSGEKYTIGIEVPQVDFSWMFFDPGNPYPGGQSDIAGWDLGFRTFVTPVSTQPILMVKDGKLGIGTDSPEAKLHVKGEVRFSSGSAGANQSVTWSPGNASWSFTSDRNTKEAIEPVNPAHVLDRLLSLPIAEWNYIGHGQRHIGPMAQDFHAAFPLNESDTTLNDADLHGVALAAIQGLNGKLEAQNESLLRERETLRGENTDLRERLEALEKTVERLASALHQP
ncbi:MAG: tail fiber domain-containing protein [Verrucomicrobiae bacterium]|nr:tail fiber domain-containing protein [Verrucomicrobiae bacterium]